MLADVKNDEGGAYAEREGGWGRRLRGGVGVSCLEAALGNFILQLRDCALVVAH